MTLTGPPTTRGDLAPLTAVAFLASPWVYVAGGSSERLTVVRPIIDRLSAAGVRITYDWTRDPGWEVEPTADVLRTAAESDLEAIRRAALVWYVAPVEKSEGSASELGAAIALQKTVIVSGHRALAGGRIFPYLAAAHYPTHEDAFGEVVAWVRRRG